MQYKTKPHKIHANKSTHSETGPVWQNPINWIETTALWNLYSTLSIMQRDAAVTLHTFHTRRSVIYISVAVQPDTVCWSWEILIWHWATVSVNGADRSPAQTDTGRTTTPVDGVDLCADTTDEFVLIVVNTDVFGIWNMYWNVSYRTLHSTGNRNTINAPPVHNYIIYYFSIIINQGPNSQTILGQFLDLRQS